jgi:hypothetical protein
MYIYIYIPGKKSTVPGVNDPDAVRIEKKLHMVEK